MTRDEMITQAHRLVILIDVVSKVDRIDHLAVTRLRWSLENLTSNIQHGPFVKGDDQKTL